MQHRFFDIVIETENGEVGLDREFVLDVPEHDMSVPTERMEYVGDMLDTLVAASGCSVCSFRSEIVENFAHVGT
jgi:hypothetical protein